MVVLIKLMSVVAALVFVSCASDETLRVRQFHLSSVKPADYKEATMVRGVQMYRLKGAVTLEERREQLGQYYTVAWKRPGVGSNAPLKIVMEYQQSGTGSETLRMVSDVPAGESSGKVEFKVTGDAYRTGGRVIAWRIRMIEGNRVLAEKRSYLWR